MRLEFNDTITSKVSVKFTQILKRVYPVKELGHVFKLKEESTCWESNGTVTFDLE